MITNPISRVFFNSDDATHNHQIKIVHPINYIGVHSPSVEIKPVVINPPIQVNSFYPPNTGIIYRNPPIMINQNRSLSLQERSRSTDSIKVALG